MTYSEKYQKENQRLGRCKYWPYESKSQWDKAHSPVAEKFRNKYRRMNFMDQMAYHERKLGIYR